MIALFTPYVQASSTQAVMSQIEWAARALGLESTTLLAANDAEMDAAFAEIERRRPGALLVASSPFFDTRRARIIDSARRLKLPAIYQFREYPLAGGLMSYGVDLTAVYRQSGRYAARIVKGEKPAELPVVRSANFELVINRTAARELNLEVPAGLLAQATELVE